MSLWRALGQVTECINLNLNIGGWFPTDRQDVRQQPVKMCHLSAGSL